MDCKNNLKVDKLLHNVDLKKQMKLSDLEAIFWSLQSSIDASDNNPVNQLRKYIVPEDCLLGQDVYSSLVII